MIDLQNLFYQQKRKALEIKKLHLDHREHALKSLRTAILSYETEIIQALRQDFHKPAEETLMTEIFPVLSELNSTLRNFKKWAVAKCVPGSPIFIGSRAQIQPEPKGCVLIISPWNYPILLSLQPLISAIAAGNTVILKPSELTPKTSALLQKMLSEIFPSELVSVIQGDKTISQQLLQLPFDHIFFTGSTTVGKLVMQEAAKNLTPVTLELGGKSPVIVCEDCDLADAAKKIIWGKVLNLGQTCVAPDYVFVPEKLQDQFLEYCLTEIRQMTAQHPLPLVISPSHHQRLQSLLQNALNQGGLASSLSPQNLNSREMGISLVKFTFEQAKKTTLMQEEIFGPLLPILSYKKLSEALDWIQSHPHPLSLYLFSKEHAIQQKVIAETYSGSVCINDMIIQIGNHSLPFGGIGASGMGQYHGAEGFRTFSHLRSILLRKRFSFLFQKFYPPYGKYHQRFFRWIIRLGL